MKEIIHWIIDKITVVFPGLLLRLLYPPAKVAKQIIIELRGDTPINISLGSSIPRIDLYLEVINLSNFNLIIDRILIEIWFGQPTLNMNVLEHYKIEARSVCKNVFTTSSLSEAQVNQIKPYTTQSSRSDSIKLYVKSYFNTKIGVIKVESIFERRKV